MEKLDKTSYEKEIANLIRSLHLTRDHAEQILAFERGINASDIIEISDSQEEKRKK